jgi:DUF4097 and DUF4098 domain-containing protein YvlB
MKTLLAFKQKSRPALLGALLLTAAAAWPLQAATTESNLHRTFAVQPGGRLVMEVDRGSIDIATSDRGDVQVEVTRKVTKGNAAKAAEIFAAHEVTFDQDGDRVEVRARIKKDAQSWFNRGSQNLQVEYHVLAPRQFNLELRTAGGEIVSTDIEGSVKASTAGGSLRFRNIKGPFDGQTAAGEIRVESVSGRVTARTSGGGIEMGEVGGDTLATTAAGSITIHTARAGLSAKTSGGGIEIGQVIGPAELRTAAGSIRVKSAQAKLDANTSGGGITIDDARDTVVAHTAAGSITASFSEQPHDDCQLTTAGGSIDLRLADKLAFDVEARTSGGDVTTELPLVSTVVGRQQAGVLQGKLNGGGKRLLLKTSAGNIALRKR